MAYTLALPRADRSLAPYTLSAATPFPANAVPPRAREAYAAAHVVGDPFADNSPASPSSLDWVVALAYGRQLWSLVFAVAEAMATAQRGMGLDWPVYRELIRRS